nr:hypothetical protein [Tanacetum cinerariifolium]
AADRRTESAQQGRVAVAHFAADPGVHRDADGRASRPSQSSSGPVPQAPSCDSSLYGLPDHPDCRPLRVAAACRRWLMVKLDRYIGKSVFMAILAVLGIILGLASLFAFIDEMADISDTYTFWDAGSFVVMTAPRRLYDMLPMAALIGCLIGLGALASSSELTIMRAAGVSIGRIVWAVMKPMLVLMVAGLLIGEYVAPVTEAQAQAARSLAQGTGDAQSAKHGLWHRQGDEFIHINTVQPNGLLYGVTRYRFDDQRHMLTSSFAKQANFKTDYWLLKDVTTTVFHEGRTEVVTAPEERWNVALSPQLLRAEQRSLLAGVLHQDPPAAGDRRPGADGHFFHLRAAALGDAGAACVHRCAGGLHLPHRSGPAGPVESGIRLLATVRRPGAGWGVRAGGDLVVAPRGLIAAA